MRKRILPMLLLAATLGIFSCEKSQTEPQSPAAQGTSTTAGGLSGRVDDSTSNCPPTSVMLVAGQTIDAGQVTVTNDASFIYVTYASANGYVISQTHLYVGPCDQIPVNNPGNPMPGQFPYKATHNNVTTYTYQVPISALEGSNCGCIAAHCVVKKLNGAGTVVDQQTGWGNGVRINLTGGNWGMKFDYCVCP